MTLLKTIILCWAAIVTNIFRSQLLCFHLLVVWFFLLLLLLLLYKYWCHFICRMAVCWLHKCRFKAITHWSFFATIVVVTTNLINDKTRLSGTNNISHCCVFVIHFVVATRVHLLWRSAIWSVQLMSVCTCNTFATSALQILYAELTDRPTDRLSDYSFNDHAAVSIYRCNCIVVVIATTTRNCYFCHSQCV